MSGKDRCSAWKDGEVGMAVVRMIWNALLKVLGYSCDIREEMCVSDRFNRGIGKVGLHRKEDRIRRIQPSSDGEDLWEKRTTEGPD